MRAGAAVLSERVPELGTCGVLGMTAVCVLLCAPGLHAQTENKAAVNKRVCLGQRDSHVQNKTLHRRSTVSSLENRFQSLTRCSEL